MKNEIICPPPGKLVSSPGIVWNQNVLDSELSFNMKKNNFDMEKA